MLSKEKEYKYLFFRAQWKMRGEGIRQLKNKPRTGAIGDGSDVRDYTQYLRQTKQRYINTRIYMLLTSCIAYC